MCVEWIPRRKHTTLRTRRKFEINKPSLFTVSYTLLSWNMQINNLNISVHNSGNFNVKTWTHYQIQFIYPYISSTEMEHAIIQPKFLPCKYIYDREIEWKGRRENLIEMRVPCRVIRILKALLTLQARCNLIMAGFLISVLRLRSFLQASDWSYGSEASYFTLLVSFYGKMQVYGTVMSVCANAGLWYRNVRMCQCRFMVL